MNPFKFLRTKAAGIAANLAFDNWPVLMFQRLFFRKNSLVVYEKGNLTFVVDFAGGDATGTRLCVSTDMYTRYFARVGKKSVKILDLGANGGGFPLCLRDKGIEVTRAVCVEMNPRTYTRLAFNLVRNIGSSGTAINAAVAGRGGTIQIPKTEGGTSESIYFQQSDVKADLVTIPLVTLDGIVNSNFAADDVLDVAKIDVEGAEYEIFFSETSKTIERFGHIIIELHHNAKWTEANLIERISSFGFELIPDPNPQEANVYFFERKKNAAGKQGAVTSV